MRLFSFENKMHRVNIRLFGLKISFRLKYSHKDFYGLNTKQRTPRIIVSLTSFPPRIKDIHWCITSLLNQSFKPDKVILWLAEEQFPEKEKNLTKELLLLKNNGLTINWCKDIKSYKKLLPALEQYPNDIIITADDDLYYEKEWLELLYEGYKKNPNCIHAHRVHKLQMKDKKILPYEQRIMNVKNVAPSFLNLATSGAGILFPPHSLYKDIFNKNIFMKLSPYADDIWFWAMAVLNNIKINVVENNLSKLNVVNGKKTEKLHNINITNGGNTKQLFNIIDYYPSIEQLCYQDL